jgi:DNA-binding NtrC family response regulator
VITLPSLRDRKEDIPLLINHFLNKYSRPSSIVPRISPETSTLLHAYPWPGNVRELENEIRRVYTLYPNAKQIIESMLSESIRNHIPLNIRESKNGLKGRELRNEHERTLIAETLKKCNNNISETAKHLGFSRFGLYKKIKRLKIDNPYFNHKLM